MIKERLNGLVLKCIEVEVCNKLGCNLLINLYAKQKVYLVYLIDNVA